MNRIAFAACLSFLLNTAEVFSQESAKPVRAKFLIEAGIEYGGDEILQVFFTNGEDQTMRAGQGGSIAVGGELQFAAISHFMVRGSMGFKYNTTAADNASIRLTRFPIQIMPYYKINDDFRLGVGATTHLNPKLKGDGFLPDMAYSSSIGPRFEFGYKWIALTYTLLKYKDEFNQSFSANSIGASVSFTIPNK